MIEIHPIPPDYEGRHYVAVRGVGEMARGETVRLEIGESATCGRSRHCEWSLKRTPHFLKTQDGDREALKGSMAWKSTSRRHCRISFLGPDLVDVENLSQNGTLVDGKPVERILLTDCRDHVHRIQLGPHGVVLELHTGGLPVDQNGGGDQNGG